jgi:integrase
MFHHEKRGKKGMYYVYWRENGKLKGEPVGTKIEDVNKFKVFLANRLQIGQSVGEKIINITFDDLCSEYIDKYSMQHKRPDTINLDRQILKIFKFVCTEVRFASEFTHEAIENYKVRREKLGISRVTTNRHLGMLKNMMKYSFEKKYINIDYSSKTKKFKLEKKPKIPVDKKYIYILLNSVIKPYKTAIYLSIYAGLRRGESCFLEWTDIDFEQDLILIRPKPHLKWTPKEECSIRKVPFNQELKEYLLELYREVKGNTNFVCFYPDTFEQLKKGVLTNMFGKLKERLNLPKYLVYQKLRHVYATSLAEKGVPLPIIAALMGHSKSSDVAEMIYIELGDAILAEAANKIKYKQIESLPQIVPQEESREDVLSKIHELMKKL